AVGVPLLVVGWIAGIGFGRTQTDKVDRRLETEARAAALVFATSVSEADRRAGRLAKSRRLQQALATRDRGTVEKLARHGEVVYRTYGVNLVGPPTNVSLVASTPRSVIESGAPNRTLWTLLALALTLMTVGALGYAVAPVLVRRERSFGVLGGARDEHAVTLV